MTDQIRPIPEDFFRDWKEREELAENMIPLIGKLYRSNNVTCYIYGRSLVNRSVLDIMTVSYTHLTLPTIYSV